MPPPSLSASASSSQTYDDEKSGSVVTGYANYQNSDAGAYSQEGHRSLAVAAANAAYQSDLNRRSSLVANSGSSTIVPSVGSPSEYDYTLPQTAYGTEYGTEPERSIVSASHYHSVTARTVMSENQAMLGVSKPLRSRLPPPSRQSSLRPTPVDAIIVAASTRTSFDDGARQPSSYKRIKKARSVMIVTTPTVRSATSKTPLRAPKSESFLRGGQEYMPESWKRQQEKKNTRKQLYRKTSAFFLGATSRKPSMANLTKSKTVDGSEGQVKQSKGSFRAIKKMGGTIIRSVRKKLGIQKSSRKALELPIQHVVSSREHFTKDPDDTIRNRCGLDLDREAESSTLRSIDPLFGRLAYDVAKELPNTMRPISTINEAMDGTRTSAANTWNTTAIMSAPGCAFQNRLSIIAEKRSSVPQATEIFATPEPVKEESPRISSHEQALANLLEEVAKRRVKMGLDEEDVVGKAPEPPELLDVRKRLAQKSSSSRAREHRFSSFGTVLDNGSRKSSYSWSINNDIPRVNYSPVVPGALEVELTRLVNATSKASLFPGHADGKSHSGQPVPEPLKRPTSSIYSRSTNGRSVSPESRPNYTDIASPIGSPVHFNNRSNTNHIDFASTHNFWAALEESASKPIPPSPERGSRLKVKRRNIYYNGVEGQSAPRNNENENLRSQKPKSRIPMANSSLSNLKERRYGMNGSALTIKGSTSVVSFKTDGSSRRPLPLAARVTVENPHVEMENSDPKFGYIGMPRGGRHGSVGSVRFL